MTLINKGYNFKFKSRGYNMQCKKCDYETSDKYYDDNGNEFLADHYCYDNKYYNSETEKYEDDDIVVIIQIKGL